MHPNNTLAILFCIILQCWPLHCATFGRRSSCLDRYLRSIKHRYGEKIVGRFAHARLIEERGDVVIIKYECPRDYHAPKRWRRFMNTQVMIHCFLNMNSYSPMAWPICRSPYENVTCSNEYFYSNTTNGKKWLRETKNLVHAEYSPNHREYVYRTRLSFRCPPGYTFHNALGLVVVETECKNDGGWKKEWPLCRGNTCGDLYVTNGIVHDKNQRYDPGVVLYISCEEGYYLWGSSSATCTKQLRWSNNAGECLTEKRFRSECQQLGRSMEIGADEAGNKTLYCSTKPVKTVALYEDRSGFRFELAIGIGIPSFFAVIVFTIFAVLYVRHQRKLYSRRQPNIRAVFIGRETVQLILPTYEEAMKNKPTTPPPSFEETFALIHVVDNGECSSLHTNVVSGGGAGNLPPSYTPT